MALALRTTLRAAARKHAPVRLLADVYRYLGYRYRLARQDRAETTSLANLPPPRLRHRVHGAMDPASYVAVGQSVARLVANQLRAAGVDLQGKDVLDFACGPSRVLTHLADLAPDCRLQGSDIDHVAISWATTHLGHIARFSINELSPPAPFPDQSFDVVYSISLFTHLDETAQDRWLAEFRRMLRPGGVLLATVHGAMAQASCSETERAELAHRGFSFRVDAKGILKLDGLPDAYQTAFHTRPYVEERWARGLELVAYVEGGLDAHQDVVMLRQP